MDELRVEFVANAKPPHIRPYLNGEKLKMCKEIREFETPTKYEDYINENGNREFKFYGNFKFENGILYNVDFEKKRKEPPTKIEIKDGD
jgi:hypothetical protein